MSTLANTMAGACRWSARSIAIHTVGRSEPVKAATRAFRVASGSANRRCFNADRLETAMLRTRERQTQASLRDCFAASHRRKPWGWHDSVAYLLDAIDEAKP